MLAEAYLSAANAHKASGDINAALNVLAECADKYPDDSRPLVQIAWLHQNAGRIDEANEVFARLIKLRVSSGDMMGYGGSFDKYCDNIFRRNNISDAIEAVDSICAENIKINGPSSWALLYTGAVDLYRGSEENSFKRFADCVRFGEYVLSNSHGSLTYKDDNFVREIENYEPTITNIDISAELRQLRHATTDDVNVIYVVSCDGFYFSTFAKNMFASIANYPSHVICHVHVVNPQDDNASIIQAAEEAYPDLKVNVTYEHFSFPEWLSKLNKKSYYTCTRYMRLPMLMKHYGRSAIVSEFDGRVITDPSLYAKKLENYDVGLTFYDSYNHFPWNRVWAGTTYVSSSENGLRFANTVANYCAFFLDRIAEKGNLWHIDQNALHCVYRYLTREKENLKVQSLKENLPAFISHHGGIY